MTKKVEMEKVIVFTDGACSPNPGKGGWGAFIRYNEIDVELSGNEAEATNNRMELMGAIRALEDIKGRCSVIMNTDSMYVKNGIANRINGWKARGWKTQNGNPVKNKDLWIRLNELTKKHRVQWHWVRGHGSCRGNIIADELAVKARMRLEG